MENTAARKRKQVPEGYLIIGIDPHKKRHAAVAITQDFTIRDKFKFDNTREGLEVMLSRTRTEMVKADCRGVMFAIETGGHYWRNIAYFLDEQGIPFRFINQYTLKRRREGKDLNHKAQTPPVQEGKELGCTARPIHLLAWRRYHPHQDPA